jgi:RES domain-containing protein
LIDTWRIVGRKRIDTAFSGEGSRKRGSRWTSPGYRVVYTSQSASLATLEVIVHGVDQDMLEYYICICAKISEELIEEFPADQLPEDWRDPTATPLLQKFGNDWLESASSCVLKVPSAVIPIEYNFIINPSHPDFSKIQIGETESWTLDSRLAAKV